MLFSSTNSLFDWYYPVKENKTVSSYFGYRDLLGKTNFHNGIDFPLKEGTSVFASNSGVVVYGGFNTSYGNCIIILHNNGYKSLYGHLSENFVVKNGDYIYAKQLIGFVGPKMLSNNILNGVTTGPHLHFSIFNNLGKHIDPFEVNLKNI
ncbi:MAG: M23 family metallopeptidase [Clostridia bacterium]|nr:M23 family metallopeptidase [Clostridia bacterium]